MLGSILMALAGGALIGGAASMLLLFNGRIAGISGIYGSALGGHLDPWRVAFLLGLVGAGALGVAFAPEQLVGPSSRSLAAIGVAGLIVGVGVRLGAGCTSGHGICGLARLAPRSMVATATFMFTGALTATFIQLLLGGTV
jgi:uncharacterized membrane protein YedE/YeeE